MAEQALMVQLPYEDLVTQLGRQAVEILVLRAKLQATEGKLTRVAEDLAGLRQASAPASEGV